MSEMDSLASFASRPNCLMIYFLLNLKFEVPDVPPKGENEFANVHVHLFFFQSRTVTPERVRQTEMCRKLFSLQF